MDIWKLRIGAANPVRLTNGAGNATCPKVAPDGQWIAFGLLDERGQYVYVMGPDGSNVHLLEPRLREKYTYAQAWDWSPDSKFLAGDFEFRGEGGIIGIAAMDATKGTASDVLLLDHLPGRMAERPRWSPDGRFLVYEAVSEGSWHLWITKADGTDPRRLTSEPGNVGFPVWSPDGKFVYYRRGDRRSIWRLPMDASGTPTAPAQLWAQFPKTKIGSDALAFTKDQAIIALTEEASDLWLVEFPEK
jgi:Tol biopolymer transport system component